jgi:ABC-type dipeptide/oligopeptide/nickel transport system permease component
VGRTAWVIRRIIYAVLTIFVTITLNFVLFRLMPGNYADQIRSPHASAQAKQELLHQFGLDQSKWTQYVDYLKQLAHANMGISIVNEQPVWPQLVQGLRYTIAMITLGTVASIILGIITGMIAAWKRSTWQEHVSVITALIFYSVPTQWLAMMLIFYLAPHLGSEGNPWPIQGIISYFGNNGVPFTGWTHIRDMLQHMFLPALTLTLTLYGEYTLVVRSAMLETMGDDFVLTARAKGLPQRRVVRKYALRNAMLPTVSMVALSFGTIVAGSLLIEVVFSYPGIGFMMESAVSNQDYWMLQAGFLLLTFSVIIFNFVADLIYFKLDPRITE